MDGPSRVLFDNRAEDGFGRVQRRRRQGIAVSVIVYVGALALFWFFLGITAVSSGDPMKLAEWLSFSGLPAMLLVFGTIQELQKPLDIRVCCDAVWTSGRRRIPVDRLRGAKLEEGPATVRLRRPEPQSKRFWFVVRKRSLADCDHFKSAVQAILRSQEVEEPGS